MAELVLGTGLPRSQPYEAGGFEEAPGTPNPLLIKSRLMDSFGDAATFKVIGEPVSLLDAERLAESDPYQFQYWALGLVRARPVE
ncbi:MAG: hypothetical protein NTV14_01205 [Coprothermobacterota bacterium]|nr:hypothetical protein [Coprothermobacterota bacterium]